jgi:hypothetical protein
MGACFLTHHGTVLCFGADEAPFRHMPIEAVDEAAAVIAEADASNLRAGVLAEQAVQIRPAREARMGVPRAIGIGRARGAPLVSLVWRGRQLCAGGGGPAILQSDQVEAWEEFLPLDEDDLVLLRDLARGGWRRARNGRPLEAGTVWTQSGYALHLGDLLVDLRLQPPLGGRGSVRDGSLTVLDEGWRVETFRRFDPVVVWRHDGDEAADEEIVLGLRSLIGAGGFRGTVRVASRFGRERLLERVEGLEAVTLDVSAPAADGMIPAFAGEMSHGPFLFLANGVLCQGPVMPLLDALAGERDVAAMTWRWDDEAGIPGEGGLFARDPAEGPEVVPLSGAVLGVPNGGALRGVVAVMRAVAANHPDRLAAGEAGLDDLLRYAAARMGGVGTGFLARRAVSARPEGPVRPAVLVNYRGVPASVRAQTMRAAMAEARERAA